MSHQEKIVRQPASFAQRAIDERRAKLEADRASLSPLLAPLQAKTPVTVLASPSLAEDGTPIAAPIVCDSGLSQADFGPVPLISDSVNQRRLVLMADRQIVRDAVNSQEAVQPLFPPILCDSGSETLVIGIDKSAD